MSEIQDLKNQAIDIQRQIKKLEAKERVDRINKGLQDGTWYVCPGCDQAILKENIWEPYAQGGVCFSCTRRNHENLVSGRLLELINESKLVEAKVKEDEWNKHDIVKNFSKIEKLVFEHHNGRFEIKLERDSEYSNDIRLSYETHAPDYYWRVY